MVVTEQYPKGSIYTAFLSLLYYYFFVNIIALGNTVSEIDTSKAKGVFSKTKFSMVVQEVAEMLDRDKARDSVVLFGIEVWIKI